MQNKNLNNILFKVSHLKQTPLIKINKWLQEAINNEVTDLSIRNRLEHVTQYLMM